MKNGVSFGVFISLLIPGTLLLFLALYQAISFPARFNSWVSILWIVECLPFIAALIALRWARAGCILGLISITMPLFNSFTAIIANYDMSLLTGLLLLIPTSIYLAGAIMGLKEATVRKRTFARA